MRQISEMRARRFPIVESSLKSKTDADDSSLSKEHAFAMPNATVYPGGDAYFHYRSMVMAASLPDGPHMPTHSFSEDQPFSAGYSKADDEMISMAAKLCGFPGKKLSGSNSIESKEVHRNSPTNHNAGRHPK